MLLLAIDQDRVMNHTTDLDANLTNAVLHEATGVSGACL